jgi:hypothetical protein
VERAWYSCDAVFSFFVFAKGKKRGEPGAIGVKPIPHVASERAFARSGDGQGIHHAIPFGNQATFGQIARG